MELKLSDRTLQVEEQLMDLTLRKYFAVMKIIDKLPKDEELLVEYLETIEGQLDFFDMVECLIDDYDSILVDDMGIVNEWVSNLITNFNIDQSVKPYIEIAGNKYATRTLTTMNDLTSGEYISIKVYQDRFGNDIYAFAPYVLAILIRPAEEVIDEETGETRWIQQKFDKKDIANIEWRANQFLNARAGDLIPVLNFFLNTKGKT